jgi:hypothetical protein
MTTVIWETKALSSGECFDSRPYRFVMKTHLQLCYLSSQLSDYRVNMINTEFTVEHDTCTVKKDVHVNGALAPPTWISYFTAESSYCLCSVLMKRVEISRVT